MAKERTNPREQAFLLVFEKAFHEDVGFDELIAFADSCENLTLSAKARAMIAGIDAHLDEIDETIEGHLTTWKKSRLSKVALTALRVAVYELCFVEQTPVGVVISEAVRLCDVYGTASDKPFVNGVLGAIAKEQRPQ